MNAQEIVLALRADGWLQKDIAEHVSLSQGAISHIKTGRNQEVLVSTYQHLLELYESWLAHKRRHRRHSRPMYQIEKRHDA